MDAASLFARLIALIVAIRDYAHGAHWLVRGPQFAGDHALLFGELYEALDDELDKVVERAVVRCGPQIAEPAVITQNVLGIATRLRPINDTPIEAVCMELLSQLTALKATAVGIDDALQSQPMRDIGMSSYLGNLCEAIDTHIYKISQRAPQSILRQNPA
ncbi:hypothetical protein EBT31_11395 [bacterium]|nr:hypothetical protein [bacterium]